ncbi:MAG: hypothetical protein EXS09_10120 [Gemmataceae bacterium]|nr:hypothetical protein [Gemmataceae bacterium]
MKILLIAPFFPPHRAVASLRTYSFAKVWAAAGHDVTVLTTIKRVEQSDLHLPTAGFRVEEVSYSVPRFLERVRAGEHATRASAPVPAITPKKRLASLAFPALRWLKTRTGIFAGVRAPDLADFWIEPATRWAIANGPWDAVVSSFGPPAAIRVGQAIKGRKRCRIWAIDFRDLWTENHLYGGLFPITLWERHLERRALKLADCLTTVSPGLAKRLKARSGKPVEVIYNGYDPEGFANLDPAPAFSADGKLRLVYTGTLYAAGQNADGICAAVAAEANATLVIASDQAALWHGLARKHGLGERFDFRGSVPRSEALRLQRDASALILLDWRDSRQGVMTGKVFEYLLSPAPIWVVGGAMDSPVACLVGEAGRGFSLGSDVGRMRQAIQELAIGGAVARPANQQFLARLSREAQASRFLEVLEGS